MSEKDSDRYDGLREQAEQLLKETPNQSDYHPVGTYELLHELQIHQAELMLQNEELKKSQHDLSELRQEYEELYEFAPCGYITLSNRGIITRANLTAVQLLGTAKNHLYHTTLSSFLDPEFEFHYLNVRRQCAETGEKKGVELLFNQQDRPQIWVLTTIEPDRNEDNTVRRWRVTLSDISDRKKAEEELYQVHKMETLGTLTGGISHDFNNILQIIFSSTTLALDELPLSSSVRHFLESIEEAGYRASNVVKQLATCSLHHNGGHMPLQFSMLLKESIRTFRPTVPGNIEIVENITTDDCPILGNNQQLQQMVFNLCSNAVDAMSDSGGILDVTLGTPNQDKQTAVLRSNLPGPCIKLAIRDTGCGIDYKNLTKIYDPYYTTKEFGSGSGLGLAMVRGIVLKHEGEIKINSRLGRGTTVTILFPHHKEPIAEIPSERADLPRGTERILIVDDEPVVLRLLELSLKNLGYKVMAFDDPRKALRIFREAPSAIDLVITDMAMPFISGDQLAAEMMVIRRDLPIILCTGYSAEQLKERNVQTGFRLTWTKPVNIESVAREVRKVLDAEL